jgi:hypothetical protein
MNEFNEDETNLSNNNNNLNKANNNTGDLSNNNINSAITKRQLNSK